MYFYFHCFPGSENIGKKWPNGKMREMNNLNTMSKHIKQSKDAYQIQN